MAGKILILFLVILETSACPLQCSKNSLFIWHCKGNRPNCVYYFHNGSPKVMRLTFSILNAPVNLKTFTGITSVIVRIFNTQRSLDSACDFLYNYKTLTVNGNITYVSFKKSESELFTGDSPRTIIHQENVYL